MASMISRIYDDPKTLMKVRASKFVLEGSRIPSG